MTARIVAVVIVLAASVVAADERSAAETKPAAAKVGSKKPTENRRIIGILDVHLDGVPRAIAAQFQKNLEAKLDSTAYWLAPQQRMQEMLDKSTKWTEGCVVGSCLMEVKVQTGAEVVLLASISGSGTSYGYVITLVRTDTGRFVAQETNRCDVCTVNEALAGATAAAVKLVTALPDKFPDEEAERKADFERRTRDLEAAHARTKSRHRTAGFVLTLTGVVVTGVGMALYVTQDNKRSGIATTTGGVALALGGVVTLTF